MSSIYKQCKVMMEQVFDMEQDENGECEVVKKIEGHTVSYLQQFGEGFWTIDGTSISQSQVVGKLISLRHTPEKEWKRPNSRLVESFI